VVGEGGRAGHRKGAGHDHVRELDVDAGTDHRDVGGRHHGLQVTVSTPTSVVPPSAAHAHSSCMCPTTYGTTAGTRMAPAAPICAPACDDEIHRSAVCAMSVAYLRRASRVSRRTATVGPTVSVRYPGIPAAGSSRTSVGPHTVTAMGRAGDPSSSAWTISSGSGVISTFTRSSLHRCLDRPAAGHRAGDLAHRVTGRGL